MTIRVCLAALAVIAIALTGCSKPAALPAATGTTVGTVNDSKLTTDLIDAFGANLEDEMAKRGVDVSFSVTTDNLPMVLDEMTTVELLAQEAVRRGFARDRHVQSQLSWLTRKLLAEELQSRLFAPLEAAESEVLNYFGQHRDEFGYGLKVQWMILADTVTGRQLLDSLRAGADFAALARRHSLDSSIAPSTFLRRSVGMALNWSLADEEALFALSPGQFSHVIKLPKGCQIVKVLDKKRIVDNVVYNEAVAEYIRGALTIDKQRSARDSLLAQLRQVAKIEYRPQAYFEQPAKRRK